MIAKSGQISRLAGQFGRLTAFIEGSAHYCRSLSQLSMNEFLLTYFVSDRGPDRQQCFGVEQKADSSGRIL